METALEYSLNGGISGFNIDNAFSRHLTGVCHTLGTQLKPFNVLVKKDMTQYGVVDIAFQAGISQQLKQSYGDLLICQEAAIVRSEMLKSRGVHVPLSEQSVMTALFYDYLLSMGVCYVEVEAASGTTIRKFLATKNLVILSNITGVSVKDLQAKYGSKTETTAVELRSGMLRRIEFTLKSGVVKLSCPNIPMDSSEVRVLPLFCITAFLDGLEPHLRSSIIEFDFFKDNKEVRTLGTTLNRGIMLDYYKNAGYVDRVLNLASLYDGVADNMLNTPLQVKVNRGYIKVPELGSSRYDLSGVRALNFARLLNIRIVPEVDRSFIDVDLNTSLECFKHAVYSLVNRPSELANLYLDLLGRETDAPMIFVAHDLVAWSENMRSIGTTVFLRVLHSYMVGHPQFFPSYTGKPDSGFSGDSMKNYGVSTVDF